MASVFASLGTPGQPWGEAEKQAWVQAQSVQRSYNHLVVKRIEALKNRDFEVHQYGTLSYSEQYPLFVVKSKQWDNKKSTVLVTGGVHGYETSGVMGALSFLETCAEKYSDHFNFLVAPCVSPWGFETINRWNPLAVDPNRSFVSNSKGSEEAAALMQYVESLPCFSADSIVAHFDLHETTNTDLTTFRPALAARDGAPLGYKNEFANIPDGFYCVGNTARPALDFQSAVVRGVQSVTHIAPPDDEGLIIGESLVAPGVILYAARELGLCMGLTSAPYVTTTEVYPDSEGVTDDECTAAQVMVITSGLDFIIALSSVPDAR